MPELTLLEFAVDDIRMAAPASAVREVLREAAITPVPRSEPGVAGLINLRGRVLAAVDVRARAGRAGRLPEQRPAHLITEIGSELVSLLVDRAADVVSVAETDRVDVPDTTPAGVAHLVSEAYRVDGGLLLVVSLDRVTDTGSEGEAS